MQVSPKSDRIYRRLAKSAKKQLSFKAYLSCYRGQRGRPKARRTSRHQTWQREEIIHRLQSHRRRKGNKSSQWPSKETQRSPIDNGKTLQLTRAFSSIAPARLFTFDTCDRLRALHARWGAEKRSNAKRSNWRTTAWWQMYVTLRETLLVSASRYFFAIMCKLHFQDWTRSLLSVNLNSGFLHLEQFI